MIKISKSEMLMLQKKGFKFGEDLHKNHGTYNKYWATTSPKLMRVLNKYRDSITNN